MDQHGIIMDLSTNTSDRLRALKAITGHTMSHVTCQTKIEPSPMLEDCMPYDDSWATVCPEWRSAASYCPMMFNHQRTSWWNIINIIINASASSICFSPFEFPYGSWDLGFSGVGAKGSLPGDLACKQNPWSSDHRDISRLPCPDGRTLWHLRLLALASDDTPTAILMPRYGSSPLKWFKRVSSARPASAAFKHAENCGTARNTKRTLKKERKICTGQTCKANVPHGKTIKRKLFSQSKEIIPNNIKKNILAIKKKLSCRAQGRCQGQAGMFYWAGS